MVQRCAQRYASPTQIACERQHSGETPPPPRLRTTVAAMATNPSINATGIPEIKEVREKNKKHESTHEQN